MTWTPEDPPLPGVYDEDPPSEPDNVFELFLALAVAGLFFIGLIVCLFIWGP
jgi:hypothetical protein